MARTKSKAQNFIKTEIEGDREFKAHVYQQLLDLQPFLSEESQVSVAIQVSEPADETNRGTKAVTEKAPIYTLTLHANLGEFQIDAEGRDTNRYTALSSAKQQMLQQLNSLVGASVDSRERNAHIRALTRGELTLH